MARELRDSSAKYHSVLLTDLSILHRHPLLPTSRCGMLEMMISWY